MNVRSVIILFGLLTLLSSTWSCKTSWSAARPACDAELLNDLAARRQLEASNQLSCRVVDPDSIRAVLHRQETDEGPELATRRRAILQALELAPVDDYPGVLEAATNGIYDPQSRTVYVSNSMPEDAQSLIRAHELGHALSHTLRDPSEMLHAAACVSWDALMAQRALVEGDAVVLTAEFAAEQMGMSMDWQNPLMVQLVDKEVVTSMPRGLPVALSVEASFPYVTGLRFVRHYRARGSWALVDAMYHRPPISTEQVLHPDKYDRAEPPILIDNPGTKMLAGYELAHRDTLGELGLYSWLRQRGLSSATAGDAVVGWGGDAIRVDRSSRTQPLPLVVVYTVWDREAGAANWLAAFHSTEDGDFKWLAERRGRAVLHVTAPTQATRRSVLETAWNSWTVQWPANSRGDIGGV